jgi:hypothetical protein
MALALEIPIVSTDYLMDLAAMSPHSDPPIPSAYVAQLLLVVAMIVEPGGEEAVFLFPSLPGCLCSFAMADHELRRSKFGGTLSPAKCLLISVPMQQNMPEIASLAE